MIWGTSRHFILVVVSRGSGRYGWKGMRRLLLEGDTGRGSGGCYLKRIRMLLEEDVLLEEDGPDTVVGWRLKRDPDIVVGRR